MDPRSGEVLGLRHGAKLGDKLIKEQFEKALEGLEQTDDERRALEKLEQGDKLIAVTEEVAHAQRVGQRELERRRRRRRQLKGIAGS